MKYTELASFLEVANRCVTFVFYSYLLWYSIVLVYIVVYIMYEVPYTLYCFFVKAWSCAAMINVLIFYLEFDIFRQL